MLVLSNASIADIIKSKLRTIEWKEISSENGITVYSPKSYDHKSGLVPIRFKALIKHNISKVITVLADNKRKSEWLPNLKITKLLEKRTIQDFTVYYRYDAPWPFQDRDFIVRNLSSFNLNTMTVSVDIKSVEHKNDPSLGESVRGIAHDGYSIIKSDPNDKRYTIVEMAFINEFGGFIPSFITNLVQKKWPYKFMDSLRKQLSKSDILIAPEFIKKK